MKSAHLPSLFAFFFLLLALAFLAGTLLAFTGVQAAPTALASPTVTPGADSPSPTPTQDAARGSANMTGITILGILLVAIIVIGLLWGGRVAQK